MKLSEFIGHLQAELDARGDCDVYLEWEGTANEPRPASDHPRMYGMSRDERGFWIDCENRVLPD